MKICLTPLVFMLFPAALWASCDSLRADFMAGARPSSASFSRLSVLVKEDDLCVKNLVGRLHYEGKHFPKDLERAHSIFYELSERNYPPAQFNLAYILSADENVDPRVVVSLLQGLVISYVGTDDYGKLASNARELGRQYLEKVAASCGTSDVCPSKIEYSSEDIRVIRNTFEGVVRSATYNTAAATIQRKRELKSKTDAFDAFVGMLTLGMAAHSISQNIALRATNAANAANAAAMVNGNALNIANQMRSRLWSVTPVGGNMLYMIPLN